MREAKDGATGPAAKGEVCELLHAWSAGDTSALERLTPIVYEELHRLARRYMEDLRELANQQVRLTGTLDAAAANTAGPQRVRVDRVESIAARCTR